MIISKISVFGGVQKFEYVKEIDTGGKCRYSMTVREDGRESFYNALLIITLQMKKVFQHLMTQQYF